MFFIILTHRNGDEAHIIATSVDAAASRVGWTFDHIKYASAEPCEAILIHRRQNGTHYGQSDSYSYVGAV